MLKKIGLIGWVLLLIMPMSVLAIQIEDYTDPDIFTQESNLGVEGWLQNKGKQDQTSFHGVGKLSYDMEYSTLPFKWNIGTPDDPVMAAATFDRGGNQNNSTERTYDVKINSEADKYLNDPYKYFGFCAVDFKYHEVEGDNNIHPDTYVSGGVGYGRVITATPLMKAYRIAEDLKKYGILTNDLSDAAYLELAKVIKREGEFKAQYGLRDYDKYWYQAMEEVLKKEGVLKNNVFGVFGVLKIKEIFDIEKPLDRWHGWRVGAGVGYWLTTRNDTSKDATLKGFAEYTKPFGFKWQLRDTIDYSHLLRGSFDEQDNRFSNALSLTYEITDQVDWINRWDIVYVLVSNADDKLDNELSTSLRYYLSHTIDVMATLSYTSQDYGNAYPHGDTLKLTFTLNYTLF